MKSIPLYLDPNTLSMMGKITPRQWMEAAATNSEKAFKWLLGSSRMERDPLKLDCGHSVYSWLCGHCTDCDKGTEIRLSIDATDARAALEGIQKAINQALVSARP